VKPVGFIDDDPLKKGKKLHGFPILGTFKEIESIVETQPFDGLFMSFRDERAGVLDATAAFCKNRNIFLKRFSIQLEELDVGT
jgi:UDP-GlcNAc:undecaprenyl-phosphate GlcNAc-1-phosphate transferase